VAISKHNKALSYGPNKASALFNLGVVKWKGKNDPAGAIADWQKLLATNPHYAACAKGKELIAQQEELLGKHPKFPLALGDLNEFQIFPWFSPASVVLRCCSCTICG
jgi:hypothetical protein